MKKKLLIRYAIFIAGLFLSGIGVAMTIISGIGSTPMSVVPLVLVSVIPITFGTMNFLWSLSFVIGQIILMGDKFQKKQYIQFLICPIFGLFIDLGMFLFKNLNLDTFTEQLIFLLAGVVVLALGVYLQVLGDVIINPGEGIVKAIAYRTRMRFGNAKILFDSGVLLLGVVLSVILLGKIVGVGLGTLIIALSTGTMVKFFKWLFEHLDLEWLARTE